MPYNREYLQLASKNYITKHITVKDVCYSDTALKLKLDNTPTSTIISNSKLLSENILEPIIYYYGKLLNIHCMYRKSGENQLNQKVGGVDTSEHCDGMACDFTIVGISTKQIFNDIISGKIKKDGEPIKNILGQCIYENNGAWIHISYNKNRIRKQFMTALNGVYKKVYKQI